MRQASEHCAEDFGQIFGTNVESTFHLCQLAYPVLKESGNGSIVFISSVAGTTALPGLSVYGASKGKFSFFFSYKQFPRTGILFNNITGAGAINQLTKNLACEWAKDGIRVNTVAPFAVTKTSPLKPVRYCVYIYILYCIVYING